MAKFIIEDSGEDKLKVQVEGTQKELLNNFLNAFHEDRWVLELLEQAVLIYKLKAYDNNHNEA